MKSRQTNLRTLRNVAALTLLVTGSALAFDGEIDLTQAKVNPAQAREFALKACLGKIVAQEIEKETGGSGLRYSFVIVSEEGRREVGVDAKTGAILEKSVEGKNAD